MAEKVDVQNVNQPGYRGRVDAAKYTATKSAIVKGLAGSDALTYADMKQATLPHLPEDLFPGGKTAGWWIKCVQLDLEAKGEMSRTDTKPLRFFLS